jgi:hypothetical protein
LTICAAVIASPGLRGRGIYSNKRLDLARGDIDAERAPRTSTAAGGHSPTYMIGSRLTVSPFNNL